MPATEQTWRDSKLMHLVFGISGLAMLATTIWMFAADHRREWKDYVRKFQEIETWTAEARLSQQGTKEYRREVEEAEAALLAAREVVPDAAQLDDFEEAVAADAEKRKVKPDFRKLDAAYKEVTAASEPLKTAAQALKDADDKTRPAARERYREASATFIASRERFLEALNTFIAGARFREDDLASKKKFGAADLDVARSEYELGVGNELAKSQLEAYQNKVDDAMKAVDAANLEVQEAKTHRLNLESIVAAMTADETEARKKLDDLLTQRRQLEKARDERQPSFAKTLVSLPILDAFGGTKVDQIWLPKLTIYNNFSDVARFDRCTNCHLAMDKTAAGTATSPLYRRQQTVSLEMVTPAEAPAALQEKPSGTELERFYDELIADVYGLQLADKGLFDPSEPTVSVVRRETAAAKAQLEVGDVIEAVNGVKILDKPMIYNYLVEGVEWNKPLKLTVRRGFPNPYATHPRLDLFVGSLSPHKMADIGCTICHDGQGSATAFKWASHSINTPAQAISWQRDLGWFDNHHWSFPMYPKRFAESLCLKCHHEVAELEPSEKFPDPPAPKLMAGYHLIQQYGCYGCHEINGYDGPNRRIGPDLRTEPNYAAAAEALSAGGVLDKKQQVWASDLIQDPTNDAARHALSESLKNATELPGDASVVKKLVNLLDDVESPGKLRKVGPSLRHVKSKLNFDFLYSWLRQPSNFRPSTKMPQFFGLTAHLDGKGLEESHRFEPIEIRGVVQYLLDKSQPFEYTPRHKNVSAEPSAERGKLTFQTRCLACHQHADFPAGTMEQGPDLSRMGAKLAAGGNTNGGKWLYTWLRNPSKYHARTFMPNMILDPVAGADGKLVDPAADIATFLLGSTQDWQPTDIPGRGLDGEQEHALDDLAMDHLKAVYPRRLAETYLQSGIPESRRSEIKGDEVELVGDMTVEKKLRYIGRRTISKYGCSGCHDVPGFEDAKQIGTGLADWARKTPDKLAFEQIVEYMKKGHGAPGRHVPEMTQPASVSDKTIEESEVTSHGHEHFNFIDMDPDTGFFLEKLVGHQREGFIWQKLREPRSYDYQKTQNKGYNERLRMPQFTVLDDAKREAIITFVLGLVAEPPAPQYVYRPTPRRAAIAQGLQVVQKFNCTGCHTLAMDRWQIGYEPSDFGPPATIGDFAFLEPHFSPQQIEASKKTDERGLRHATITGTPVMDEEGKPLRLDEDTAPIEADDTQTKVFYSFVLWDDVLINGEVRPAGLQNLLIPESRIEQRYLQVGGYLPRLAFPVAVLEEKKANPNAKADEAWGWLPPPLVREGRKVQTAWLHDFLLDPHMIRPATILRMPKFNMSPAEATKLVNYFAAVDGVDYPYDFDPRTRESHLEAENAEHPHRLADALKIVTDANFCTKCHLLGDFNPTGSERAKGPQLDAVYKRLRPEYTLPWIANPKRLLPYTSMPVNVPYDKPVSQSLYKGTSDQQLNAVVDLLLNYDRYLESKVPIAPMIKAAPPEAAGNRAGEKPQGEKSQDQAQ
jgi:cytochrome c2